MTAGANRIATFIEKNASRFLGELRPNEPLSKHTYYRIGGASDWLAVPKGEADLRWIAELVSETGIQWQVLGAGSNVLASDKGFRGLIVKTIRVCSDCDVIQDDGKRKLLRVGASVSVPVFLRTVASQGVGGFAFLSGIPGSMGGVVAMNAGTHLGEVAQAARSVKLVSLQTGVARTVSESELRFHYRGNSFIRPDEIVYSLDLEGNAADPAAAKAEIDEVLKRRKETQPLDLPSCGSVFKNPKTHSMHAWQVIDQLKLRGHRIGNAQFSEKHCNFIVNLGQAKASDVRSLIQLAKTRAKVELSIDLEEEVRFLGDFDQ